MSISVVIDADLNHFNELNDYAAAAQDRFHFVRRVAAHDTGEDEDPRNEEVAYLEITTEPLGALFVVKPNHRLRISTWRREGITLYAELRPGSYLVLCSLLALTQWRALALNPLLRPEDFIHIPDIQCLFSSHKNTLDPVLAMEKLQFCPGCRTFYHCLGVDEELRALDSAIRHARTGSPGEDDRV